MCRVIPISMLTIDKVAVEAVAGGIALRENPDTVIGLVWHLLWGVVCLHEEVWELEWIFWRTDAVDDLTHIVHVTVV